LIRIADDASASLILGGARATALADIVRHEDHARRVDDFERAIAIANGELDGDRLLVVVLGAGLARLGQYVRVEIAPIVINLAPGHVNGAIVLAAEETTQAPWRRDHLHWQQLGRRLGRLEARQRGRRARLDCAADGDAIQEKVQANRRRRLTLTIIRLGLVIAEQYEPAAQARPALVTQLTLDRIVQC
jgi:hypothetical protein